MRAAVSVIGDDAAGHCADGMGDGGESLPHSIGYCEVRILSYVSVLAWILLVA